MPQGAEVTTQCFLSYRREDNDQFGGIADRLKTELEGMYAAHTGRQLEIFIDRASIGWGDDWRQAIRISVERATAFIPLITMRYFASGACRDELLTFYANAENLGVTGLILPIVLAGEDKIEATDSREEVRLIERLNQKRVREAWLAGYDSASWRTFVFDLVTSLDSALRAAEESLVARESSDPSLQEEDNEDGPTGGGSPSPGRLRRPKPSDQGSADVSELALQVEELMPLLQEVLECLQKFGDVSDVAIGSVDWADLTSQQQKVRYLKAARQFGPVAAELGEKGAQLRSATAELDVALRSVATELASINSPIAKESLAGLIAGASNQSSELGDVAASMTELTEMLKFASVMNISLRKALRPGIQGLDAVRGSIDTIDSWRQLSPK